MGSAKGECSRTGETPKQIVILSVASGGGVKEKKCLPLVLNFVAETKAKGANAVAGSSRPFGVTGVH